MRASPKPIHKAVGIPSQACAPAWTPPPPALPHEGRHPWARPPRTCSSRTCAPAPAPAGRCSAASTSRCRPGTSSAPVDSLRRWWVGLGGGDVGLSAWGGWGGVGGVGADLCQKQQAAVLRPLQLASALQSGRGGCTPGQVQHLPPLPACRHATRTSPPLPHCRPSRGQCWSSSRRQCGAWSTDPQTPCPRAALGSRPGEQGLRPCVSSHHACVPATPNTTLLMPPTHVLCRARPPTVCTGTVPPCAAR